MDQNRIPEPSELIYLPRSSAAPIVVALGITALAAGTFMGWVLWVIGAALLLLGGRAWWRLSSDEVDRMRRSQRTDTAVLPAEPIRRS